MFAKVFSQIFTSSISRDRVVRYGFMDLLVLADRDGVVDMTAEAIARVTNVPEDVVDYYLAELQKPDHKSRTPDEDGCRIVLLDHHRDWGWRVVNYRHYRDLNNDEARREYFRKAQRDYRSKNVKDSQIQLLTPEYENESASVLEKGDCKGKNGRGTRIPPDFVVTEKHRLWAKENNLPLPDSLIDQFRDYWTAKSGQGATKCDWNATFRNWIRNPINSKGNTNGTKQSQIDAIRNSREFPSFE